MLNSFYPSSPFVSYISPSPHFVSYPYSIPSFVSYLYSSSHFIPYISLSCPTSLLLSISFLIPFLFPPSSPTFIHLPISFPTSPLLSREELMYLVRGYFSDILRVLLLSMTILFLIEYPSSSFFTRRTICIMIHDELTSSRDIN